jgi:hypothetical protein
MKLIGRYGNGIAALFFVSLVLYALRHGDLLVALCWTLVCALACFNVYMFGRAWAPALEEERLQADVHTADLRRTLSSLSRKTPETVARNHGA